MQQMALYGIKDYNLFKKTRVLNKYSQLKNKILILYAYYECEIYCPQSLEYFMSNGISSNPKYDFIIIINGDCKFCQSDFFKNYIKKNIGWDFGAWSSGLLSVQDFTQYKYFIFMNTSVIGPIFPKYLLDRQYEWPEILFTQLLNNQTKMVGITLSKEFNLHIQTYMYAVDNIALDILQYPSFDYLIQNVELQLAGIIIKNGYNIDTQLLQYASTNLSEMYFNGYNIKRGRNYQDNPTIPDTYGISSKYDLMIHEVSFFKYAGGQRNMCKNTQCSFDHLIQQFISVEN